MVARITCDVSGKYTECLTGYAVTGGQDTVINVFSLDSTTKGEPEFSLIGHGENVCALDVGSNGVIISGSWDRCVLHSRRSDQALDIASQHGQGVEELQVDLRFDRS